jgi:hypothetical protein
MGILMSLDELFEKERYIWVLEYGMTHNVIRLAVHDGDYPRYTEVICGGCTYFAGKLEGGPYAVAIERTDDGSTKVTAENFCLVCTDIRVGTQRT